MFVVALWAMTPLIAVGGYQYFKEYATSVFMIGDPSWETGTL
jgi:hypothetical protein